LLGLEAMAREDFGLPAGSDVPPAKQQIWLKSLRESRKIETKGPDSPACALVDGDPVAREAFGAEIEKSLDDERRREALNETIGIHIVAKLARASGVEIGDDDVTREIAYRKSQFEADPRFQGVQYEQYLNATHGTGSEAFRVDGDFRAQVLLKKIVLKRGDR